MRLIDKMRPKAVFFASSPGQAITYQIGKLQIVKFLADARLYQKEQFNLRNFHDYLWKNGNVAIALLRWEHLGLSDEIEYSTRRDRAMNEHTYYVVSTGSASDRVLIHVPGR